MRKREKEDRQASRQRGHRREVERGEGERWERRERRQAEGLEVDR